LISPKIPWCPWRPLCLISASSLRRWDETEQFSFLAHHVVFEIGSRVRLGPHCRPCPSRAGAGRHCWPGSDRGVGGALLRPGPGWLPMGVLEGELAVEPGLEVRNRRWSASARATRRDSSMNLCARSLEAHVAAHAVVELRHSATYVFRCRCSGRRASRRSAFTLKRMPEARSASPAMVAWNFTVIVPLVKVVQAAEHGDREVRELLRVVHQLFIPRCRTALRALSIQQLGGVVLAGDPRPAIDL